VLYNNRIFAITQLNNNERTRRFFQHQPSCGTTRQTVGNGTFRAQDLWFPRTNSPYGELSFPRLFVLENFRSRGTKVPGNFRSLELSFPGTFVPPTILQSISYEPQTAVTTVRICFVVGLVLFVFQKAYGEFKLFFSVK